MKNMNDSTLNYDKLQTFIAQKQTLMRSLSMALSEKRSLYRIIRELRLQYVGTLTHSL